MKTTFDMKTLAFAKPLILVLVGLPGSGKSFFARQFAEMFGAPLVSYDQLRYELFSDPRFSLEEQDIIERLAHYQIGELLKTKRSFVVDGGGNSKTERQTLSKLAKAQGYDLLGIWVQTDDATAKYRSLHRGTSRPDDKYSPRLTEAQFNTLIKRYAPPHREDHIVISGKHAFSTQAKTILRRLSTPHAMAADIAHEQRDIPENRPTISTERPDTTPSASVKRRSMIIS